MKIYPVIPKANMKFPKVICGVDQKTIKNPNNDGYLTCLLRNGNSLYPFWIDLIK